MAGLASSARAAELEAAGRPFAVATVVAVRRPTSARPGRARDRPSGRLDRGLGRRQLRPARRRARGAARARRRAAPPAPPVEGRPGRGSPRRRRRRAGHDLPLRWHAGDLRGTACPRPACGSSARPRSPARWPASAGRRLAGDRHRPDRRARGVPRRRPRSTPRPTSAASIRRRAPYVVVASQGEWDEEAVAARADPRGVVRRARRLADPGRRRPRLAPRGDGVAEERIAALRAPAGLDLGAETAEEVALSILAELVQVRRGRADFVASPGPATIAGAACRIAISLEPVVDDIVLARSGLRDDRRAGARPPPRRARRDRLRVLLDRLPDAVHQGAGGVSCRQARRPRAGLTGRPHGGLHALRRLRADQGVPRQGLGIRRSIPTRSASAGRASSRSRSSTTPTSRRRPRSASASSPRAST